jgi:uncharacterized delta-60 repeat protein
MRRSAAIGLVLLTALLAAASAASADTMVLQPDGKIVLAGRTWPESGTLARLNPDGSLDTSFGASGFVTDHRLPGFRALALGPDGRIVGAAIGGFQLARYLPDGSPDTGFAGGGVGGWRDPAEDPFQYSDFGPSAVLVRPDGTIVVGGTVRAGQPEGPEAQVRAFDAGGQPLETVGQAPPHGGQTVFESHLAGLLEEPDGSLLGGGWTYASSEVEKGYRLLLGRFVPDSGTEFDPRYGNGAGLVRTAIGDAESPVWGAVLAASGEQVLLAGRANNTFLLARFNRDGTPDTGFGQGGYVAPPIEGPASVAVVGKDQAASWANGMAVEEDGTVILGGATSQWSEWHYLRGGFGPICSECPQPMLAKFDSSGPLDPGFGSGGLLRLAKPDGGTFVGEVEQVATLADGKYLVKGSTPVAGYGRQPWVARLNVDGSYDKGFGSEGLTVPRFPCTDQPAAEQRATGCSGSAKVRLRTHGLRGSRPSLSLRVQANVSWAPIRELGLILPRGVRFTKAVKSKLRLVGAGPGTEMHVGRATRKHGPSLSFQKVPNAPELRVTLRRGAFRWAHRPPPRQRKLAVRIGVYFSDLVAAQEYGGNQTIVRHAG